MAILNVVIQSTQHNYPGILFSLTKLLNSKCVVAGDAPLDYTSPEYLEFRTKMQTYQVASVALRKRSEREKKKLEKAVFNQAAVDLEVGRRAPSDKTAGKGCWEDQADYGLYTSIHKEQPRGKVCSKDLFPTVYPSSESKIPSFPQILEEMIVFFSKSQVNVAIKLREFYEFQKAYLLLLGVLTKAKYPGHRLSVCMNKAIVKVDNVSLDKAVPLAKAATRYYEEKKIADGIAEAIQQGSGKVIIAN